MKYVFKSKLLQSTRCKSSFSKLMNSVDLFMYIRKQCCITKTYVHLTHFLQTLQNNRIFTIYQKIVKKEAIEVHFISIEFKVNTLQANGASILLDVVEVLFKYIGSDSVNKKTMYVYQEK